MPHQFTPNSEAIPYGHCHCGCGQATTIATRSATSKGWVKGAPLKFIRGHATRGRTLRSVRARLLAQREIDPVTGCWNWTGYRNALGYGQMGVGPQLYATHRLSAAEFLGFILDSPLFICHRCDNPPCFNPDHLFIGTAADNVADAIQKGRPFGSHPGKRGMASHQAKLTDAQIRAIRKQAAAGISNKAIAREFGVSDMTIGRIVNGVTWSHVV